VASNQELLINGKLKLFGRLLNVKVEMEKWLSTSEVQKLRLYCEERAELAKANGRFVWRKYRAIIEFLLGTGLRASEVLDTKITDLYLDGNESYIKVRTLKRIIKEEHIVLINEELANILTEYLQALKKFRPWTSKSDYLFPGRRGKRSPLHTIEKAVRRIFENAQLPRYYSVHSLRHTHGFMVYNKTKNLKLVKKRLRHVTLEVVSWYARETEKGEERETINSMFGKRIPIQKPKLNLDDIYK
jgi:integrase